MSGPPYRRLNLSLFRQFPAPAETHFEFRAEVFNLTNTPNFAQPGKSELHHAQHVRVDQRYARQS